jgi:hypothetical protein
LFLGLIVTGCSEGDDVPAVVNYDATGTKLDVIVGIADASSSDEGTTEKGIDVPAEAYNMVVSLIATDKVAIEESFVAQGSQFVGASFWRELGDNKVMMSSSISEEEVAAAELTGISDITAVAVMVYNQDGALVGTLCQDDVALTEGGKNTIDFTAADAPAFVDAATLIENSTLELTTDPEADDTDVVTIAVDETVTVTGAVATALSDVTTIREDVAEDDLILSLEEDTTALTIDGNVVTGVSATSNPVTIVVTYTDPEDATVSLVAEFSVQVDGSESTEESVEESTEESTEESVEESTEESTEESVEESTEESTEESVEESTEESTEESVEESSQE